MKKFRDWKFEAVELAFGVERVFEHPLLDGWLQAKHEIPDNHRERLEELRYNLIRYIDLYNEEELKVYFIAQVLQMIPFHSKAYRPFMDRMLSATYGEEETTTGKVDWMLAQGKQDPRQPFFFLHEYKREVEASGDPLGQLLIAMMAARQQNQADFPMYGCYVLGRNWFFVVLDGDQYAVSDAYVSTQEDLFRVYEILKEAQVKVDKIAVALG